MVTWLERLPVVGLTGSLAGFARLARVGQPSIAAWWGYPYRLSSPGTVDANAVLRGQYPVPTFGFPKIDLAANFNFSADDIAANPGMNLTATMFIALDSDFDPGTVPTPLQIIENATIIDRGNGRDGFDSRTTAGDIRFLFSYSYPGSGEMPPNTKYWIAIVPTAVASMLSTPSAANDIPIGNGNVNGRAISAWSNRTPEAPIITSPSGQVTTFAGGEVELIFVPQGPDRIAAFSGDSFITSFDDVAGVQIQYSPKPTAEEPDPEWEDLPIAVKDGLTLGRGWYIDRSATAPANDGAKAFWETYRLKIKCGTSLPAPGMGYLPAGNWRVRVRTFDYGHALPPETAGPGQPPLADATGSYTPDNYPAVNTSSWSNPVSVFVTPQVPAPEPLSPKNNVAVAEGAPVSLVWRYRNTYQPPYPQARRNVQIRRVGDSVWTTLEDGLSSSTSLLVTGFDLVSGNAYEWRVKVTDSAEVESAYSEGAVFWVIPTPSSGAVIPAPSETIDGGTLGCGTHTVHVYRKGGRVHVGQIRGVERLEWNRLRDDISDARIVIKGWDTDCGNLLGLLHPWAYEIVIFRKNGESVDRVWEGPITLLTYEKDQVVIQAKDVMAYAYRRIVKQIISDSGNSPTAGRSVVARATAVLQAVFAPDDPNVLAYLNVINSDVDAKQYRSLPAYSRTAYEEVDDMAANAGLDYVAVGRSIVLWGTKNRIGTLPEFRDKDLGNSPIVSEYGMSMANRYVVSDGNGVWGEATRLDEDGKDPDYGLVEMLSSTWASDSTEETGTFTQEGVQEVRESFAESAERSIASRYPVPVVVRIPDNTTVSPDAVISIQHLVPGVVIPLHSTSTLRTVRALQKLDSVKVVEVKGEETISITLSPFSRQDNEVGEME